MADSLSDSDTEVIDVTPIEGGADSSSATGAEPKTMLEAVQAAITPIEEPEGSEAKAGSPAAGETGAEALDSTPKVDDYAEVPFNKHPRFRQLLKERNSFREKLSEKDAEISRLKTESGPQQEGLQRFNSFANAVRGAGLDAKEVNDGFAIMAEMKRDPERALQMVTPYVNALLVATGRRLEGDLGQRVQAGTVDADTAGQLQRERHARMRLEQQSEWQRQALQRKQEEDQTHELVTAVTSSVSAWEERQKVDPDYQKKQPLVIRELGWLMQQEGYPQNPQIAVDMAERAKRTVEKNLSGLMPQRQPVRTVTGGASAASAAARPKSLDDAIRLAARGEYQTS